LGRKARIYPNLSIPDDPTLKQKQVWCTRWELDCQSQLKSSTWYIWKRTGRNHKKRRDRRREALERPRRETMMSSSIHKLIGIPTQLQPGIHSSKWWRFCWWCVQRGIAGVYPYDWLPP
jgi:hypothetical protein